MDGPVTFDMVTTILSAITVAVFVTIYLHRQIHNVAAETARHVRVVETAAAEERKEMEGRFNARYAALTAENMALKENFALYREHALETFMSKGSGSAAIDRVGSAVRELKDDLASRMTRLENILLKDGRN